MPSKEVRIYVIVCFYIERKCLVYFSSLQVTACLSSYFELRTCRPKTGKLRQLLAECPYRGPEYECEGVMEAEEEEKGTEEEEEGEGMGKEYKKGSAGGVREQTKKVADLTHVPALFPFNSCLHSLPSTYSYF